MQITLQNIGKKFARRWVFKGIDFSFNPLGKYALLGPNGSGKSTLLQIIAGNHSASAGAISYTLNDKKLPIEEVFRYISFAAPYLDLPEELTFREILIFHSK